MNILKLIKRSIYMDLLYIFFRDGSIATKIEFIFTKYFLLLKHKFVPFKIGESYTTLNGKKYYYEANLGIVLFQVSLIHHVPLLRNLKFSTENPTLLDVGANVGCFSLIFKDVFAGATVFAFEPVPVVYGCLERNLNGLPNIYLNNIAISDTSGKFKFSFDPINTEMGCINEDGNIDVEAVELDNFVAAQGIDHIDFLKIDTETYEKAVLLGALNILSKTKYILLEVNISDTNKKYTFSELISLLNSDLYNFQLMSIVNFLDKDIGKATVFDLLFVNTKYD